jgi:peptide/nickel transport system substrate-binding protein
MKRYLRGRRARALQLTVLVAVLATLVGASTAGSAPRANGGINVRLSAGWRTFDFQVDNNGGVARLLAWTYDRLVARGKNGNIVPYLATSWDLSPKQRPRQAVFHIRKGATCSDGTPVTPLVILNSFKRLALEPKVGSNQMATYFGPGPYHVTADMKKWTFTWRTEFPFKNMLSGMAGAYASIVCPAGLAAVKADPRALQTGMYGSGPYTLVSATAGEQVELKLRPEWKWGPLGTTAKDLPDTASLKIISDNTTAANLVLTGAIDVTQDHILGADVDRLVATKSLIHKTSRSYSTTSMIFSQFPGRFLASNDAVRAALMTAVNTSDWNIAANAGQGKTSNSLLAPGAECYSKEADKWLPKGGVDRAKALLQADGWTFTGGNWVKGGKPMPKLVLLTNPATMGQGGPYLQNVFEQVGIHTELQDSTAQWSRNVSIGNFDISVNPITFLTPEAAQEVPSYAGKSNLAGGSNFADTGQGDDVYQRAALYLLQYTGSRECSLYRKFEQRLLTKYYFLPLAAPTYHQFGSGTWDFNPGIQSFFEPYSLRKRK